MYVEVFIMVGRVVCICYCEVVLYLVLYLKVYHGWTWTGFMMYVTDGVFIMFIQGLSCMSQGLYT